MINDNRCRFCDGAGGFVHGEFFPDWDECTWCKGTGFRVKESASPELQRILSEALKSAALPVQGETE